MNFYEAYTHLKEGKKIRRKEWNDSLYLKMDELDRVNSYIEEYVPFEFDISIINSDDWCLVDNDEKTYSFIEVLPFLENRHKVKLKSWPDGYYIVTSKNKEDVYTRRIVDYAFVPSFSCFTSNDWEVID